MNSKFCNYYTMKIFEIAPPLETCFLHCFSIITDLLFVFPRTFFLLNMYFMLLEQTRL